MKHSISIFDRIEAFSLEFVDLVPKPRCSCERSAHFDRGGAQIDLALEDCYKCSVAESIRRLTAMSAFLDGKADEVLECKRKLSLLILDRAKVDAQIHSLSTVEKMRLILNN